MISKNIAGISTGTLPTTQPGYCFGLGFAINLDDGQSFWASSKCGANWGGTWGSAFRIDPKEALIGMPQSVAGINLTSGFGCGKLGVLILFLARRRKRLRLTNWSAYWGCCGPRFAC